MDGQMGSGICEQGREEGVGNVGLWGGGEEEIQPTPLLLGTELKSKNAEAFSTY